MLAFGVAWLAGIGEDLNANATEGHRVMMQTKYDDIVAQIGRHAKMIDSDPQIPNYWFTRP